MASGFSGGGHDFYAGRSIPTTTTTNNNNNINQTQNPYATQIFLDPTSRQIFHHPNSIGKRTLADFQTQHQRQQQQQSLNGFFDLRSIKPRMMVLPYQQQQLQQQQHLISPSPLVFDSQRLDFPLLQQQQFRNYSHLPMINQAFPSAMYSARGEGRGGEERGYDSENKMMNQLQELEKQLLDDNDDEGGDAVSVITNTNSEWSETIQNIMGSSSTYSSPTQISPSPTSSSSSSSSASVTTPAASVCSKQSLLEAASAISEGKTDVASEILTRVSQASNRRGTSEQRLMEYMGLALKSRLNPAEAPPPVAELYTKEHVDSTQSLFELSPCFKLGFMAANLAIIESTQQLNAFHVVDFDIGQGGQYKNLLHALSSRAKPAPRLSITAVADTTGGEEKERLMGVGAVLGQLAQRVGVSLQFRVVSCCSKLSDLSRESLGCDPDEALVVNFAFKLYRMPDESVSTENPRDELLRRVKGLGPLVVTLVEQEMNTNTAPFLARVNEACAYYGAMMESIESTVVEKEGVERVRVEEGLGRKLGNSVACEGRERVERCEVFGKWRARMGMAGFQLKELSQNVAESMKTRLSSTDRINPGFCVKEENGGVCFGWMGKTLTVASAWR